MTALPNPAGDALQGQTSRVQPKEDNFDVVAMALPPADPINVTPADLPGDSHTSQNLAIVLIQWWVSAARTPRAPGKATDFKPQ